MRWNKNDNTLRMKSGVVWKSNVWEVYSFHVFLGTSPSLVSSQCMEDGADQRCSLYLNMSKSLEN